MATKKKVPATAGTPSIEEVKEVPAVVETAVAEDVSETSKEVKETPAVVETPETIEKVEEAEVIPSNIFIASDGTEVEFAVKHFIHSGKKYTVEEAVVEIHEVLQELYDAKSFIFKKG